MMPVINWKTTRTTSPNIWKAGFSTALKNFTNALKIADTTVHQTLIYIWIPAKTGFTMFSYSQVKIAPTASNTPWMIGRRLVWNQPTTARTAAMIPSQAGLIPFSYSQVAPLAIPSQTACSDGHRVSVNQSATALTAVLIAAHVASTASRNQPILLYASTNPATSATIAVRISPIGFARIAVFTAF